MARSMFRNDAGLDFALDTKRWTLLPSVFIPSISVDDHYRQDCIQWEENAVNIVNSIARFALVLSNAFFDCKM